MSEPVFRPGIRCVIADDEAFIRQVLMRLLQRLGVEVVGIAENGQEALDLFAEHQPDLLILDIAMPIMDGLEATRELMATHPEAKVLICTSFNRKQYVSEAVRLGARGYLNKPFNLQQIREKLSQLCPAQTIP